MMTFSSPSWPTVRAVGVKDSPTFRAALESSKFPPNEYMMVYSSIYAKQKVFFLSAIRGKTTEGKHVLVMTTKIAFMFRICVLVNILLHEILGTNYIWLPWKADQMRYCVSLVLQGSYLPPTQS